MKLDRYSEYAKIAIRNLETHRLRAGLATLGILIGVTTVISMISILGGMKDEMAGQIQSLGSDIIYLSRGNPGIVFTQLLQRYEGRQEIDWRNALHLKRECPSVKRTAPVLKMWSNVTSHTGGLDQVEVNGTFPSFADINNYELSEGRFISHFDILNRARVCVLAAEIAGVVFPDGEATGGYVRIKKQRFKVVGVLRPKGKFIERSLDDFIAIPLSTMNQYFGSRHTVLIQAQSAVPEQVDEAISEIRTFMRKEHNIKPGEPDDFTVSAQDQLMELYDRITGGIFLGMIVIGGISLIVGGIGIMNIMLVSVSERTREIGLRKALGAKRENIIGQFLVESILLSMSGGFFGILLGIIFGAAVAALTPLSSSISLWAILLGSGSSMAIGLFFGLYPARKASRLNPVEALRFE